MENWKGVFLIIVKPETVIKWHRTAFKFYWKKKSKIKGRPKISPATISLIKKIHKENPVLSPEKIHEKLHILGIENPPAPNTIAKYLPSTRKPPSEKQIQSWKIFLKNHHHNIWATDFLQFLLLLLMCYMYWSSFITKHVESSISMSPLTLLLNGQSNNLGMQTPFGKVPKYLIHDNDPIFCSKSFQDFLTSAEITFKKTAYHFPWQIPMLKESLAQLKES